jgi:O-antigen/teichoic acid export membrane protein
VREAVAQPVAAAGLTRRLLENSLALFTSQLLSKIFRVLANFLLARYLGPENFGTWALVLSFAEIFRFLPDFGLYRTLVRRLARDPAASSLSATLSLRLLFSGLAVVALGAALFFTGYAPGVRMLIYFYSLSFFLQAGSSALAACFQAQLKSASLVWTYTLSGGLYLMLILAGIFGGEGLTFFVGSLLATEGLLLALLFFTFHKKGGRLAPFAWSELKPLVREAWPFAVWLALGAVYFRIDTLLVYHFTGERGAGLYSACFRLSEGFLMLATAAAASLFPVFSRLRKESKEELLALYEKSFFWFFAPTLPAVLLVTAASAPIVDFLYGPVFAPAASGLSVIIWAVVFMFVNNLSTQALVACDREKAIAKITAVNVLVNVGLNLYLIPRAGFLGACWATLATEAANFVMQLFILQKLFARNFLARAFFQLLPAGAAAAWFFLHPASFRSAGVWLFVFGYLVFLFNRKRQTDAN